MYIVSLIHGEQKIGRNRKDFFFDKKGYCSFFNHSHTSRPHSGTKRKLGKRKLQKLHLRAQTSLFHGRKWLKK